MATLQEVMTALRNADAAGDVEAARRLAAVADSLRKSPGAMRREQEDKFFQERMARLFPERTEEEPETTFMGGVGEFFKGIPAGAVNLAEQAALGASALLSDETEDAARDKIKEIAGIARSPFEASAGYEDTVSRKFGEALGSTVPFFALGPLGMAGRVAAGATAASAGAGEARERARAAGASAEDRAAATGLGTLVGATEILPVFAFINNLGKPLTGDIVSRLRRIAATGGAEGLQEAAAQAAQNLIEKGIYNPEAGVFTGTGESLGYGAGVGGLIQALTDLALGRRAKAAPTTEEEKKPEGTPLLEYDRKPLENPIVAPDGTVISTEGELKAYEEQTKAREVQRAEDVRTSDPLAGLSPEARELAKRSKEAQLSETFAEPDLFGEFVAAKGEEAEVPDFELTAPDTRQMELDLQPQEELVPAAADEQQLDLIDLLETEQLAEMERQERMAPIVGAQNEAELARIRAQSQQEATTEQLKFESDLAELDGRIQAKQEKTTEEERLALLLPIVEAETPGNIPKKFVQALKDAGFKNTNLTDKERQLVDRVYAMRRAEPEAKEPAPTSTETAELEALIPEKKTTREPEQLGIPGIGQRRAPEVAEEPVAEVEKDFARVLTADVLNKTGLPRQSGFYRQLLNKDMADPEQQAVVADVLSRVRANPNVAAQTKEAIEGVAMQGFGALATQQEMFGPRGGVMPTARTKEGTKDGQPTGVKKTPTGVSTPSDVGTAPAGESEKGVKPAGGTGAPKSTGLGGGKKPTRKPVPRKKKRPVALTDEEKTLLKEFEDSFDLSKKEQDELQKELAEEMAGKEPSGDKPRFTKRTAERIIENIAEKSPAFRAKTATTKETKKPAPAEATETVEKKEEKKEAKKEAKKEKTKDEERGNKAWQALAGEPLNDFVNVVNPTYESLIEEDNTPAEDRTKVIELIEAEPTKLNPIAQAARIYFEKMPRTVDNLLNIAFDVVYDTPRFRAAGESSFEAAFFRGMSGENAKKAKEWVSKNLSNTSNLNLTNYIIEQQRIKDAFTDTQMQQLIAMESVDVDETTLSYMYGDKAAKRIQTLMDSGLTEVQAVDKMLMENTKKAEAKKKLELTAILDLGYALHPAVRGLLNDGKLVDALRAYAGQSTGPMSTAATKLANAIKDTKIKVVKGLKDEAGNPVPGFYDPKTDTISIDAESGMVPHVLLHEATHAATSHVLDNKSHPVTKQLTQLFQDVKGYLDTAYGATDVDEFTAEAFSNTEFQNTLSSIYPDGTKISAWDKFSNVIKNFVRRLMGMDAKGIESAKDRADKLIESILSPAPQNRDSGLLYAASALKQGGDVLDNLARTIQKGLPQLNQDKIDQFNEFFTGSVPDAVKNMVRMSLPLNALVDIAQKYIPMAKKLDILVGERAGVESKRNQAIEPIIKRSEEWANNNADKLDDFNTVVYTSTLEQVDPSKPRSTYEGNKDKLKAYDDLAPVWRKLGPDGHTLYKLMRDTYQKMYKEIENMINMRIDGAMSDKEAAKKVKADIYRRLFERGFIEPYFPLTRTGKYWLSYNALDPRTNTTEFFVEAFETNAARKRFMEYIKKEGATDVQAFSNLENARYKLAPPTSFVGSTLKVLDAYKVAPEVSKEIMELFLNSLPESSFAQGFQKRKGTPGFKRDAIEALRMKTYSISRQLSNMEYGYKLNELRDEMQKYVREKGNQEPAVAYMDEFNKRIDFAISPMVPEWSKLATSFGFNMTLGFNISSAVVNLAQIPLVVMPYLGGKYGYAETTKAIGRATRIFTTSGFEREVEMLVPTDKGEKKAKVRALPSIDNIDFSKNPELAHIETLAELALDRGQLNRSITYDVLDIDDRAGLRTKVNAWSGFVFHHGERMNRQVAMVAAYELELQKLVGKGKDIKKATKEQQLAAADYAIYVTELTNGGTVASAAPRIAQSGLGKVIFMFKRYGASMYYLLFKTTKEALSDADPEVRKQAKKQIAGIYASAALLSGVQGVPLFGVAAMIYNMFAEDDEDDFNTAARKWMGELAYTGLGNNVLGIEVASRMGLSDLIFRDNMVKDQDSAILSTIEMMGGPVFGVASRMERGLSLINEGNVQRGIEQMLPSAMGNGLKSIRYATEGAQTLRGDPITDELNTWNVLAQSIGFAPAEYTRQLEINANEKKIDRTVSETRTKLLRNYYIAMRMGDSEGVNDTLEKINRFNSRHPEVAILPSTIVKSMESHMSTSNKMHHGITISDKRRAAYLESVGEYDDGLTSF